MKISLPIAFQGDIECFVSVEPLTRNAQFGFQVTIGTDPSIKGDAEVRRRVACAHREWRGRIRSALALPYTASFKGRWHDQPYSRTCSFASVHCLRPAMASTHGNQQTSRWARCHRLSRPFAAARAAVVAVGRGKLSRGRTSAIWNGNQSRALTLAPAEERSPSVVVQVFLDSQARPAIE
jgi:hypothetical protein